MKSKLAFGASTLVLTAFVMGGPSIAADIPVAAQDPIYTKAPPPPVCPTYWSAFGGWNHLRPMSDDVAGESRRVQFKEGFVVGGAVGRCVPGWNWLRLEGEISYRRNSINRVTVSNEGSASRSGHIGALALMANVWADVPVAPNVTFHAGGGIGPAWLHMKGDICGPFCGGGSFIRVKGSDWAFAFQLGAGAAWHVTPTMAFTLDYRYFQAVNPSFKGNADIGPFIGSFKFRDHYKSHSVMAGFRVLFSSY